MNDPAPFPDGSHILHIGLPKTGTNAIQAGLDQARAALADHGIVNASLTQHSFQAAKYGAGMLETWRDHDVAARRWRRIARRFRESEGRLTVLSSEAFSQARPEAIASLARDLGGDLQVVVTLRALAPLLASWWQQRLRSEEHRPLEKWLHAHIGDPGDPIEGVLPRQSLTRILGNWGSVVGEDHITFVVPDPGDRRSLLGSFEALLGLPAGLLPSVSDGNASLAFPEAEVLRRANKLYSDRGGDKVDWMRSVYQHATPRLRQLDGMTPHRIQVPRWAAVRANELTRAWHEDTVASSARVIGELDDLYADEGEFPEKVDTPATISIDTAAQIAEILYSSALALREHERKASVTSPTP
jgi:hypothetical protein